MLLVKEVGLDAIMNSGMDINVYDKTKFSMLTQQVDEKLEQLQPKTIILCGIESHVCVLQTCLDLLARGFDVHVVADAVSSQRCFDRSVALDVRYNT